MNLKVPSEKWCATGLPSIFIIVKTTNSAHMFYKAHLEIQRTTISFHGSGYPYLRVSRRGGMAVMTAISFMPYSQSTTGAGIPMLAPTVRGLPKQILAWFSYEPFSSSWSPEGGHFPLFQAKSILKIHSVDIEVPTAFPALIYTPFTFMACV